ncbi:MAG TPA: non-canonical purine NTP pyrophosphatase [Acidobacteriaceae bacterium]|jgi:XTP/dITP diphosphohydrolase|nr:non-canonical purine NTP pyrophosphatase [Acidobacteriaceae bacterium]
MIFATRAPDGIRPKLEAVPVALYAASTNPGKLRDFAVAAAEGGFSLQALPNLRSVAAPEEVEPTFAGNARLKAEYYSRLSSEIILADDSGLEVDALGGAPGVRSARFAEDAGYDPPQARTTDERNNLYLLDRMRGRTPRTAHYRCVLAAALAGVVLATGEGMVEGEILEAPRGTGGFGYDPLFWLDELQHTMAQISLDEKHAVSHRGRAFRDLLPRLQRALR